MRRAGGCGGAEGREEGAEAWQGFAEDEQEEWECGVGDLKGVGATWYGVEALGCIILGGKKGRGRGCSVARASSRCPCRRGDCRKWGGGIAYRKKRMLK